MDAVKRFLPNDTVKKDAESMYWAYKKSGVTDKKAELHALLSDKANFSMNLVSVNATGTAYERANISYRTSKKKNMFNMISADLEKEYSTRTKGLPSDIADASALAEKMKNELFGPDKKALMDFFNKVKVGAVRLSSSSKSLEKTIEKAGSDLEKAHEKYKKVFARMEKDYEELVTALNELSQLAEEANRPLRQNDLGLAPLAFSQEALGKFGIAYKKMENAKMLYANKGEFEKAVKGEASKNSERSSNVYIYKEQMPFFYGFIYETVVDIAFAKASSSVFKGATAVGTQNVRYAPGLDAVTGKVDNIINAINNVDLPATVKSGSITGATTFFNTDLNTISTIGDWKGQSFLAAMVIKEYLKGSRIPGVDQTINQFIAATIASAAIAGPPGNNTRALFLITSDDVVPLYQYFQENLMAKSFSYSGGAVKTNALDQEFLNYLQGREIKISSALAIADSKIRINKSK